MTAEEIIEAIKELRKKYQALVEEEGQKYFDERPWVPYFDQKEWEDGILADDDTGVSVRKWEVRAEDEIFFPELKNNDYVYLHWQPDEASSGYGVSLTNEEGWERFKKALQYRSYDCRCGARMRRVEGERKVLDNGQTFRCPLGHLTWFGKEDEK